MPLLWRHKPRTQPKPQQTQRYAPPIVGNKLGAFVIDALDLEVRNDFDATFSEQMPERFRCHGFGERAIQRSHEDDVNVEAAASFAEVVLR